MDVENLKKIDKTVVLSHKATEKYGDVDLPVFVNVFIERVCEEGMKDAEDFLRAKEKDYIGSGYSVEDISLYIRSEIYVFTSETQFKAEIYAFAQPISFCEPECYIVEKEQVRFFCSREYTKEDNIIGQQLCLFFREQELVKTIRELKEKTAELKKLLQKKKMNEKCI